MKHVKNILTGAYELVSDEAYTADYPLEEWELLAVAPAEPYRENHREKIKAARDYAMLDDVTVPDKGTFQLRKGGEQRILGFYAEAMNAVLADETYEEYFKLESNLYVPFSGPEWIVIGKFCKSVVKSKFIYCEILYTQIDAAQTKAELDAIVWNWQP